MKPDKLCSCFFPPNSFAMVGLELCTTGLEEEVQMVIGSMLLTKADILYMALLLLTVIKVNVMEDINLVVVG